MARKEQFSELFEPGKIGTMTLRNRIVLPPMGTNYGDEKGFVTERLKAYYEARAKGGAGLIIVEIISVDSPVGNSLVGNLALHEDAHLPGMAELVKVIHSHGARAAAQLFHAGVETHRRTTGMQPVGASVIKTFNGDIPRALTLSEVHRLVQKFAEAALRAKRAGFDAVEIHGATYYLLAQFLSRHWNKREDHYGGSLENRARFPLEVLRAVRTAVGHEFPVWCRINGSEFGIEDGLTLEEAKEIAKWAEAEGSDAMHVSSFGGGNQPDMGPTVMEHGVLLPLAREIKKALAIPVIAVGRIDLPQAQKALLEKQADFISIGRGLIADPDLPNKVLEGRSEDVAPCIGCVECINHIIYKKGPLRCSVNALCGREGEVRIEPAASPKKLLVIGGGPAGLEASRVAALRGHHVTLLEKESSLGGLSRSASLPPRKEDIDRLITYLKKQVEKIGVQVCLGQKATPEDVGRQKWDAVIVASGTSPQIPKIKGLEGTPWVPAEDALLGKAEVGRKLLIVGGSLAGLETADSFSDKGKTVAVVEILDKMAPGMVPILRFPLLNRLKKKGVLLVTGITAERVEGKVFLFQDPAGKEQRIEFDTLILAAGRSPGQKAWESLKSKVKDLYFVGDVIESRGIMEAIAEGNRAGRMV